MTVGAASELHDEAERIANEALRLDRPTIAESLARVMASIGAVAKGDRNQAQGFSFRGVDSVINAVGPALREHGVVMMPHAGEPVMSSYESKKGAQMTHVVLPVTFTFHGPAGDSLDCRVVGEAADSGDKVMSKAHAVAWRVAMLQVFAIPTDEPDPDAAAHERAPAGQSQPQGEPQDWWQANGWADQTDHDAAMHQCQERAKSITDEVLQASHKAWLKGQGWKAPYTRQQLDRWGDELDKIAAKDGLGEACEYCQESPCACAPDDYRAHPSDAEDLSIAVGNPGEDMTDASAYIDTATGQLL